LARNVEIKARVEDLAALEALAAALADQGPIAIAQDDTFFHCAHGRLKLRRFAATQGELIFYRRADALGPKESFYLRTPTAEPDALRDLLAAAHGISGRVIKQRTLYLAGRTRIHLDRVQGLGSFMELEVVLADDEPTAAGLQEAQALMARLGIAPGQLVEGAYADLLAQVSAPGRPAASCSAP